jgi:hypothetical protein
MFFFVQRMLTFSSFGESQIALGANTIVLILFILAKKQQ